MLGYIRLGLTIFLYTSVRNFLLASLATVCDPRENMSQLLIFDWILARTLNMFLPIKATPSESSFGASN